MLRADIKATPQRCIFLQPASLASPAGVPNYISNKINSRHTKSGLSQAHRSGQPLGLKGLRPTCGIPPGRREHILEPSIIAHVFMTALQRGHAGARVVLCLFGVADVCSAGEGVQAAMRERGVGVLGIEKS